MTTPPPSPGSIRQYEPGMPRGCGGCGGLGGEADLRLAIGNLSRKYTELAEVVTRYMSEAGLQRDTRARNAAALAQRLARIVGGVETQAGQYPDCALIGRRFLNGTVNWFCSGVLVHPRVVLTAGHCQSPSSSINVVALNALDVADLQGAELLGVRRVRVNPSYPRTIGNDITVLVLRADSAVAPVPLARAEDFAEVEQTTLVGFGNSDVLSTRGFGRQREVTVDITHVRRTPGDDLDDAEQTLGFESDREFTAGGGGFDSCNGDSGGPAYIDVGGERRVAGLTSRATEGFTHPCGDGGIYTRVDTQRSFINQVLQDAGIDDQL